MTPGERVRQLCAAVQTRDVDVILTHLAETASYQNIGAPAAVGHEAIRSALAAQFTAFPGDYVYLIVHLGEVGPTVLTERIDIITGPDGVAHRLPVMGAFEVRGDRIVAWRDYWDSRLLKRMLNGEDCAALVSE